MEGISVARCAAFSVCRARSRSSGALSLGCASICVWTCCCHHRCFIQAGSMSPGSMDSSRFDGCGRFCVQMQFFHEQWAMRRIARAKICAAARLSERAGFCAAQNADSNSLPADIMQLCASAHGLIHHLLLRIPWSFFFRFFLCEGGLDFEE